MARRLLVSSFICGIADRSTGSMTWVRISLHLVSQTYDGGNYFSTYSWADASVWVFFEEIIYIRIGCVFLMMAAESILLRKEISKTSWALLVLFLPVLIEPIIYLILVIGYTVREMMWSCRNNVLHIYIQARESLKDRTLLQFDSDVQDLGDYLFLDNLNVNEIANKSRREAAGCSEDSSKVTRMPRSYSRQSYPEWRYRQIGCRCCHGAAGGFLKKVTPRRRLPDCNCWTF